MKRIKRTISQILLNTLIHPYLNILLNVVQYLELLTIFLGNELIRNAENLIIMKSILQPLGALFCLLQALIVTMVISLLFVQQKENKENVYILEYKSYKVQIIQKTISLFLIAYRKIIIIPFLGLSLIVLTSTQQISNFLTIISIINLVLSIFILLPMSGLIFLNKISYIPNIVAFPYILNIESLIYAYVPIMMVFYCSIYRMVPYTNLVFSFTCLIVMYVRPIVNYRSNQISVAGGVFMITGFFTQGLYSIFDTKLQTGRDYLWCMLISLIYACILYSFQLNRKTKILLSEQNNTIISEIDSWNFNEVLFYHILNYQNQYNSLLLYLIKQNKRFKQEKTKNDLLKQNQSKIGLNQSEQQKLERIGQKIIASLRTADVKSKDLKLLIIQFIECKFKASYDPHKLLIQNLGKIQIHDKLTYCSSFSMLISQILLLQQSNRRKCFTFMRAHKKLLQKVDSQGFLDSIESYSLTAIIQLDLKLKSKTKSEFNLNAQIYFVFEQKFQALKKDILQSCENRIDFWKENNQNELDCNKIQKMIQKNYSLSKKIEFKCFQILKQFEKKGPIILFDLISSYNIDVLNKKVSSRLNSFYPLVKKYTQDLEYQKKQGALTIENLKLKKFSLLQNIGVCMVDLQNDLGLIQWANQYFWTDFYSNNAVNHGNNQKIKAHIFDIMVPELTSRHSSHFERFTQSQKLNHEHSLAFVFQHQGKIIQKVSIEIQVFPSLTNGLKVSVFMLKHNSWNIQCVQSGAFLIKDDFSIIAHSEEFLQLKQSFSHSQQKRFSKQQPEALYLSNSLLSNEDFSKFFGNHDQIGGRFNQAQIEIKEEKFQIKLTRIYELKLDEEQGNNQSQNAVEKIKSTLTQKSKNLYLMEVSPIQEKQRQSPMLTNQSSNFKTTLTSDHMDFDIRSHSSQIGSINSQNIERAIIYATSMVKEEQHEIERKDSISRQTANIENKYKTLVFNKKPKTIRYWMYFTIFIIILLASAMSANIYVFTDRKQIYEQKGLTIKYYNKIITDISQIIIALREYNYYVYTNGVNDPHIPSLINQIVYEENEVNMKLRYLTPYMGERWQAIDITPDGLYRYIEQTDFVVIANYMLSSMTYLSEVNPQQMNFPIFLSESYGKYSTPAVINYNEAIYNGIYIVSQNLKAKRLTILPKILESMTGFQNQPFIYTCIFGIFLLLIFMAVSIRIEKRSEFIRTNTVEMLGKVNQKMKSLKIDSLEQFKYSHNLVSDFTASKLKKQSLVQIPQNSSFFYDPTIQNGPTNESFKKSKNPPKLSEKTKKEDEVSQQTKREFQNEDITDLEQKRKQTTKKMNNNTHHEKLQNDSCAFYERIFKLPEKKSQRLKFLFYSFIATPTLIYFVVTLSRGMQVDSSVISMFEMSAQIHNKKSNQLLAFSKTKQTFYYESFLELDPHWTSIGISEIQSYLDHSRTLQKMLNSHSDCSNLQDLMKKIQHGNLCQKLTDFSPSPYYDVKFTMEECRTFSEQLLTHGLKQTEIWFYETGVYIMSHIPDASLLTIQDKYQYLLMPQLKEMRMVLAYMEQFIGMMDRAFETDLEDYISSSINQTVVYSVLSIIALLLLLFAIRCRWGLISKQRKEIISIVDLISFESIKNSKQLFNAFSNIELQFYK